MAPLVLEQGRLTRNFKPAFIPPGHGRGWGEEIVCLLRVPISWKESAVKTAASWRWWNKRLDYSEIRRKNAQDHATGYQFPCKFKDRLFFADKKCSTLNKLSSCKGACWYFRTRLELWSWIECSGKLKRGMVGTFYLFSYINILIYICWTYTLPKTLYSDLWIESQNR